MVRGHSESEALTMGSGNSSNCSYDDSFKYTLYGCMFSMVFVLGLISNCVAMYIFMCTLKMRNETTTYMINLALSDLLFVFTLPFRIFYFATRNWPFGDVLCKISVMLFYTNMYGSILFLTCISVDRFLAILYPLRSKTLRTKRNARLVCFSVWLTVLGGSAPAVFFQSTHSRGKDSEACFENFPEATWKTYLSRIVIFIETVGFFIPLILNVTCSSMVLRTLNKPVTLSRSKLNKAKVLKMIFVHLVIFCFCFVPYNINLILYSLMRTQTFVNCSVVAAVRTMYPITLCIAVSNCCFDPIIYYFTSDTIQNSIKMKNWSTRKSDSRFSEIQGSENFIQHNLQTLKNKIFDNESTI